MTRGRAKASDLVKLWVIELVVVVGAIYSSRQQGGAALCGATGSNPQRDMFDCFTGSLARMVLPWAIGGSILIGTMALILTVAYAVRRRAA
jgi:hypothetical protein